jgi:hypothetical protein
VPLAQRERRPRLHKASMDFVPKPWRAAVAILAYSLCSGTMLLLNKLAMYYGKSK